MESLCRKTIQVNLVQIPPQLKELASKIPEYSPFTERHGRLLNLVNTNTEEDMVKVLFQFFDPLHHCFTFPDYQLVPTLEEFSKLFRIPIVAPQNFPSHISQDIARIISKWLKIAQELNSQAIS